MLEPPRTYSEMRNCAPVEKDVGTRGDAQTYLLENDAAKAMRHKNQRPMGVLTQSGYEHYVSSTRGAITYVSASLLQRVSESPGIVQHVGGVGPRERGPVSEHHGPGVWEIVPEKVAGPHAPVPSLVGPRVVRVASDSGDEDDADGREGLS